MRPGTSHAPRVVTGSHALFSPSLPLIRAVPANEQMASVARLQALRQPSRLATLARTYATQQGSGYVPRASLQNMAPPPPHRGPTKPESPTFYTARAGYYDSLATLEQAIHHSSSALKRLALLPLPAFARAALPPLQPVWKTKADMASVLEGTLTTARYRRATALLNELDDHRNIAQTAGVLELAENIAGVLKLFERENKSAVLARGKRKPVKIDEYGRSYTVGRRKESAARVWVIPVKKSAPAAGTAETTKPESILDLGKTPETAAAPAAQASITTTEILINNLPLATYFPIPADRERIVRPLKLTGLLGAYNVFALVRGGGTSGQAGAVAQGLSKGLAAHVPEVEIILRRGAIILVFRYLIKITWIFVISSEGHPARPTYGGAQKDWSCQGSQAGV
jgi:small subunit ribosomal protein S9